MLIALHKSLDRDKNLTYKKLTIRPNQNDFNPALMRIQTHALLLVSTVRI